MASPPPAINPSDPRVLYAAERTLLAWIRTGLALMGFGFVVARFGLFLRELAATRVGAGAVEAPHFSLWIGAAMVCLGVVVNVLAMLRHGAFMRAFAAGEFYRPSGRLGQFLALALALLGIVLVVYLIVSAR